MRTPITRVNVIRHLAFEDLGCWSQVLIEHGIKAVYHEAATDDLASIVPLDDEPLLILGGPISVNDGEDFPFLDSELALLAERLSADRPTLGICLGAQLMAKALGAGVYPGPTREIGWSAIRLEPAGEQSVLAELDGLPVLHWHGETFDLPAGAVHLARSDCYRHQAFSYGRHCLGLQFHIECTAAGLENWYVGHVEEIQRCEGISIRSLRREAAEFASASNRAAAEVLSRWLRACAGRAAR